MLHGPGAHAHDRAPIRPARGLLPVQAVCLQLWLLVTIAGGALGALIDSARRAARVDETDVDDRPGARAPLDQLERARAAIDDGSPRMLGGLALLALVAALPCALVLDVPELAAVLAAIGLGLAVPGISSARDQRRRARALDARISGLRAQALTRAGVRPRRS